MWTRRAFLQFSAVSSLASSIAGVRLHAAAQQPAEEVAVIEPFWREVRQQFALDPSLMNLDNASGSPTPVTVHDAFTRYLDEINRLPVHYRTQMVSRLADVRRGVAQELGCEPTDVTLTPEPVQIAVNALQLREGDEILTSDQIGTRAAFLWQQRARREGLVVKPLETPAPATQADVLARVLGAITPQTRVLHFCHVSPSTGQLFPVREVAGAARSRKVVTLVDGSQAVGHFPFVLRELECDIYAADLDAWLMAPPQSGVVFRRPGAELEIPVPTSGDSAAALAAIAEAVTFHRAVGPDRKAARLRYLTLRWINGLRSRPQVQILSSREAGETWGLAAFNISRVSAEDVVATLRDKHNIVVGSFGGVRVSPQVYNSVEEIDRFVAAVRTLL